MRSARSFKHVSDPDALAGVPHSRGAGNGGSRAREDRSQGARNRRSPSRGAPTCSRTPHIAGLTPGAIEHQAFDTVEQVRALVAGELPEGAVNADKATRLARLRT
jgi:hypothetical protein